jgi:hypothetical protein
MLPAVRDVKGKGLRPKAISVPATTGERHARPPLGTHINNACGRRPLHLTQRRVGDTPNLP